MPRFDDEDDYDDEPRLRQRVPFPTSVRVAAVLWIIFGALAITGNLISFALTTARQAAPGARPGAGAGGGMLCGVIIGVAFLAVGIQTLKGTAKGTLGNAIGSLIMGALYLLGMVAIAAAAFGRQLGPGEAIVLVVLAAFIGFLAIALLSAGVLALVGRSAYEAWWAEQQPGRTGRRRRHDEDDDDYHDRPPRRRDHYRDGRDRDD